MNSWRYHCFPSWQNHASGNCKNGPLFQHGGQSIHSKNNTSFHTLEISFAQRFPLKSMMRHNFSLTEAMLFKTEKSRSLELGVWYFLKTNQCSWHGLSWVVEFTLVTNDCALFCIPQNNRMYSSNNLFYFASLPWPWHVMCTGLHITLSFLGSKWCSFNSFVNSMISGWSALQRILTFWHLSHNSWSKGVPGSGIILSLTIHSLQYQLFLYPVGHKVLPVRFE